MKGAFISCVFASLDLAQAMWRTWYPLVTANGWGSLMQGSRDDVVGRCDRGLC